MTLINKLLWGVGGLIIVVLIAAGVFFVALKFNKSNTPANQQTQEQINTSDNQNSAQTDQGPAMTETDKEALSSIGIDPNKIPKTVSKEMEQCFLEKLGADRVQQFATGKANPTWDDINKIKPCLQQ